MKKIAILVLVVALIVGLVYFGLPSQTSAAKPLPPAPKGPGLITIVEDKVLGPGEAVASGWLDVKSFRKFKAYAGLKTEGGYTPSETLVAVFDNPLGDEDEGTYGVVWVGDWAARPPSQDEWWATTGAFEGLYSNIMVFAYNQSTDKTETVSLYLLRALE